MTHENDLVDNTTVPQTLTDKVTRRLNDFITAQTIEQKRQAVNQLILLKAQAIKQKDMDVLDIILRAQGKYPEIAQQMSHAIQNTIQANAAIPMGTMITRIPKLEPSDLKANGKLLEDNQINQVNDFFEKNQTKNVYRTKGLEGFPDYGYVIRIRDAHGHERRIMMYRGKNGKTLGQGSFGKAKLGQDINTGEILVIKSQILNKVDEHLNIIGSKDIDFVNSVAQEYQNLQQAGKTFGQIERDKNKEVIESKTQYVSSQGGQRALIAMPLAQGMPLSHFIESQARGNYFKLSSAGYLKLCNNILQAYKEQVQDRDLLHLDIKPDNIIVNPETLEVTFIDYGLAVKGPTVTDFSKGTPHYIPDEIYENFDTHNKSTYSEKTEIYSLGLVLASLLKLGEAKEEPIDNTDTVGSNTFEVFNQQNKNVQQSAITEEAVRDEVLNMVRLMANKDENNRPTLAESQQLFGLAQQAYLATPDNLLRVALFDVQEYSKLDYAQKIEMLTALKMADKVYLINANANFTQQEFNQLKVDFDKTEVKLAASIFYAPTVAETQESMLTKIQHQIDQQNPHRCHNCYFVTTQPSASQKNTSLNTVPVITFQEIKNLGSKEALYEKLDRMPLNNVKILIQGLSEESDRLKKGSPREQAITASINKLTEKNSEYGITFSEAKKELQQLRAQLVSKNSLVQFFQEKGFFKSKELIGVEKLAKQLEASKGAS